jgi:predicted GNAT family acetyltransferase
MKQAGMKTAMVGHSLKNQAANQLYASVGFKEHFKTLELVKHLNE